MNHIRRINNIVNGYLDMAYFIDDMQELHDICLAKFFFFNLRKHQKHFKTLHYYRDRFVLQAVNFFILNAK